MTDMYKVFIHIHIACMTITKKVILGTTIQPSNTVITTTAITKLT